MAKLTNQLIAFDHMTASAAAPHKLQETQKAWYPFAVAHFSVLSRTFNCHFLLIYVMIRSSCMSVCVLAQFAQKLCAGSLTLPNLLYSPPPPPPPKMLSFSHLLPSRVLCAFLLPANMPTSWHSWWDSPSTKNQASSLQISCTTFEGLYLLSYITCYL